MKKLEFEKFREHVLGHMDDDLENLEKTIKQYKDLRESNGTLYGAIDTMCQYGLFDVYFSDCLETLKWVYGDEFDESRYITKDREWRYKKGENYLWTVYKWKIASTIKMMIKKGEVKEL